MIQRVAKEIIKSRLRPNKVILLLGPRRVGKTYLLKQLQKEIDEEIIFWNGEDFSVHEQLRHRSIQNYKLLIGNTKFLIIDEAQKIPEIWMILKLMIDSIDGLKIIATGSSSFDLTGKAGEPLTERKFDIFLYPISEKNSPPMKIQ